MGVRDRKKWGLSQHEKRERQGRKRKSDTERKFLESKDWVSVPRVSSAQKPGKLLNK